MLLGKGNARRGAPGSSLRSLALLPEAHLPSRFIVIRKESPFSLSLSCPSSFICALSCGLQLVSHPVRLAVALRSADKDGVRTLASDRWLSARCPRARRMLVPASMSNSSNHTPSP